VARVTHLRYVGMAVPDFDQACSFYGGVWGLTEAASDKDVKFFAAQGSAEPYIYRVRRSDEGQRRLDLIGFGAESDKAVDQLAADLGSAGVTIVTEPGALDSPAGGYGFRFFDPDGRVVEVSAGLTARAHRTVSEREAIPVGLSHIVVNSSNKDTVEAFYRDRLGFRLSDWLSGRYMTFWRCNAVHHSFAVAASPFISVNHVAFELASIDDMLRGAGRVLQDKRATPMWGPGRHSAGDNAFYYFFDPVGNVSEYTAEVERVPEDWEPHEHTQADVWQIAPGPQFQRPERPRGGGPDLPPSQVREGDPGLWSPPPL
jgi:catechol 2,3-dioxygenase-like lactoylglutathione lyase family enzyme